MLRITKNPYHPSQSNEQFHKDIDGDYFNFNSPRGGGGGGAFTQSGLLCVGDYKRSNFPHPQSPTAQCFIPAQQKKIDPKLLEHSRSIIEVLKILKDADLHISSEDIANDAKNAGNVAKKIENTLLAAQKFEGTIKSTFNGIKNAEDKLGNTAHSISESGIAKRIRSETKKLTSKISLPYAVRKKIENVLQPTQKVLLAIETAAKIDTFYGDRSVQNYLEMSESLLKWTPAEKAMGIEKKIMEWFLPTLLDKYLESHNGDDLPSLDFNSYGANLGDWYVNLRYELFYKPLPPRDYTRELESLNKLLGEYEEGLNKKRKERELWTERSLD